MTDPYQTMTRRWFAAAHRRQAAVDEVLDQLDARIRESLATLAPALVRVARTSSPADRSRRLDELVDRRLEQITSAIAAAMADGREAARDAIMAAVPDALIPELLGKLLPAPEPLLEGLIEDLGLSNDLDRLTTGAVSKGQKSLTKAQAREQIAKLMLPPIDRKTLSGTFKNRKPGAAPLKERLSSNIWTSQAKTQIQSQLVTGLASGEPVESLTKRIRSSTSAIAWKARRVARTEGRRALERDHLDRSLSALGDMVQGLMIQAVMDDRTRPEHAARHGTIYRRRPDGSYRDDSGRLAPDLPDAPNCRCTMVPVLEEPDLSEPARRAYETATDKLVPDLPTYEEVWEQATVSQRRKMIGASRYDLLMKKFGVADPTLALDIDGKLLSLNRIQSSDPYTAYDRRSTLLTRQAITGSTLPVDDAIGSAANQAIASRVLARADLPRNISRAQAAVELLRRVPTPAATATAAERADAARAVVQQFTQMAALSPELKLADMRAEVWRVIGRPSQFQARVTTMSVLDPVTQGRVEEAVRLVSELVPDRQIKAMLIAHKRVPGEEPYRPNYDPVLNVVNIEVGQDLETIVHEFLHAVDYKIYGAKFGEKYIDRLKTKAVVVKTPRGTEEYEIRKDGSPGLYYYQNRRYGQTRGLEFITTMGEQLVRNPILAITGDPKGFKLWLEQLHSPK